MELKTPVKTAFGEVPLEEVLRAYEKQQRWAQNRAEFLKSDAGKEYNRIKAREYYQRHKDKVLQKRALRYEADKDLLLNRAKEYYSKHSDEINAAARAKRAAEKMETPV